MIAIILIIGALAAGVALVAFWKEICQWIKKAVEKIKQVLGIVVEGTRTFITKTVGGYQNKSKYYNQNNITGEWEETVYTKMVDESQIPLNTT